jgi:hypothetical protein
MSSDRGESSVVDYIGGNDAVVDVDARDGVVWAAVSSRGSFSGPWRKATAQDWEFVRGNLTLEEVDLHIIVADPVNPASVAYIPGHCTLNGGTEWVSCRGAAFAAVIDGHGLLFSGNDYSRDSGSTWEAIGLRQAYVVAEDAEAGEVFAAPEAGGIYVGSPGRWKFVGLNDRIVHSVAVSGGYILAWTAQGELFHRRLK